MAMVGVLDRNFLAGTAGFAATAGRAGSDGVLCWNCWGSWLGRPRTTGNYDGAAGHYIAETPVLLAV